MAVASPTALGWATVASSPLWSPSCPEPGPSSSGRRRGGRCWWGRCLGPIPMHLRPRRRVVADRLGPVFRHLVPGSGVADAAARRRSSAAPSDRWELAAAACPSGQFAMPPGTSPDGSAPPSPTPSKAVILADRAAGWPMIARCRREEPQSSGPRQKPLLLRPAPFRVLAGAGQLFVCGSRCGGSSAHPAASLPGRPAPAGAVGTACWRWSEGCSACSPSPAGGRGRWSKAAAS